MLNRIRPWALSRHVTKRLRICLKYISMSCRIRIRSLGSSVWRMATEWTPGIRFTAWVIDLHNLHSAQVEFVMHTALHPNDKSGYLPEIKWPKFETPSDTEFKVYGTKFPLPAHVFILLQSHHYSEWNPFVTHTYVNSLIGVFLPYFRLLFLNFVLVCLHLFVICLTRLPVAQTLCCPMTGKHRTDSSA